MAAACWYLFCQRRGQHLIIFPSGRTRLMISVVILVGALRNNTKLRTLDLKKNNGITKIGHLSLLRLIGGSESYNETYASNTHYRGSNLTALVQGRSRLPSLLASKVYWQSINFVLRPSSHCKTKSVVFISEEVCQRSI